MPGYSDTRQLIIDTLMGRPAGTEIQPEDHQRFALQITDYVRSVELVAGNATPIGFANADTVPVQPDNGQAVYLSYVPRSVTKNFVNFINQSGNSISVTSSSGEVKLVTLLWNGSYWSSQIVTIDVLSDDSSVNASNIGASDYILFSTSSNYSIGDIVRYDGKLYKFTTEHAAGTWNGTDVELASINSILTSKLTELSEEMSLLSVGINGKDIYIDALDVVKAFPNENGDTYVWFIGGSTYLGTFIKIPSGIKLSIKGNASADTSYCFVKEIGKINGEEVKFASNSTLTGIEWGKTISIVAPEDAVYLWVSMGTRVPQGISIEGSLADVLHVSSIVNNLHDGGSDKVLSAEQGKTLNDKIESIPLKASQEYTIENVEVVRHYADSTKWIIDYMPSEYTGCYIPVNGGDVFTIVASDTYTIYAFIKSKGVNNGDAIDFSGDATNTSILHPNVQKMVCAPNDAKFLWVCVKYNNNNRFPKSLIKVGDKVQTIGKWSLRNTTENPLEVINTDGGFARIFKNWGFIGDSFTSGNHNYYDKNGVDVGGDIFEYSWGEYIKQILGCDGYEYSTGGWTCRAWIDATNGRGWDKLQTEKRQVYTIALGCNDASPEISYELGSPSDIKSDYNQNSDTFYGNYAGIIQRIKSIQQKAIIFCITLPRGDRTAAETYNAAIRYMAEKFSNVYIIDLYKYAPPVNEEWADTFRNRYHLNAMGYLYTAWEILTYIDWIIRKNPLYFRDVAFIGDDNKFVTQDSNVYGNNGL